jgi:hypothetical protein
VHDGHHSSTCAGYGRGFKPSLSQLLTPPADLPPTETPTVAPTVAQSVTVSAEAISGLDLSPLAPWTDLGAAELLEAGPSLELTYQWPRAEDDPRELSEIPEVRLWTLRADAHHPWLPLVLERSTGQLTRHVAMLLPHGFSRSEGIRFAPEALELWLTHRLYLLDHWADSQGVNCRQGLSQVAAVLGLELDASFWEALRRPA